MVRRDTREKQIVKLDALEEAIVALLDAVQADLLEKARAHRDQHIYDAHSYDEFRDIIQTKPGFIRGMWCGSQSCEDTLKEEFAATARCMPFGDQEEISPVCVCCSKPAHKLVYWGKAY